MEEEEEARRSWPSGRESGGLFRSGSQRCGSSSASLGAMRSLVGKLDTLLLAPPSPPPAMGCYSERVMDLMRLLRDDVEAISSYLDDLSQVEDPPATASCWMNDTRDLSYDMEDYIDSLLSVPPTPLADTSTKKKKKITSGPVKIHKRLRWCKQTEYTAQVSENGEATGSVRRNIRVMITTRLHRKRPNIIVEAPEMISEFRMYLQEAIDRNHRYELHCCSYLKRPGFLMPTSHRLVPSQEADSHVVIDERMNGFINSLPANEAADEQQLKVVSVLGHGCLGKTTLAKVSYDRIGVQFDCRAFVQVSKNPDMKRLARDLFSQLGRKQSPDDCNELDNIIDSINKQLQDKRYLIVIDDLRAASVWDIIKHAFPKGNLGSRIVTTTQIEDVALACCGHQWEHVFEMKPLDDDHSRKLFFDRLFGSETVCPEELKLVSAEIVEMCGGLPLATISIASLLAKQPSISVDLLTRMRGLLSSILSSSPASERTRQALNLSYNNLPRYLKTCLMYVTMYPEGSIIFKHDLVKQWVAEGFIAAREGESMKKAAGMYFDELVDRRFIQPIHHRYNGEVVSCIVHDVVRDLVAHKSAQENFTVVVDYDRDDIPLCHKARRLSLQLGDAKYAKTPSNIRKSQVRSLGFFGLLECMPCVGEFKLLRLLNIQISGRRRRRRRRRGGGDHDDPAVDLTGISVLFHLRYLKIASDASIQLPDRMRGLQCLGTLDTTRVTTVPWDITHLPHLLHLSVPLDTNLLDWIGSMSSSDAVISLWSLGKLHSLQDLHLTPSPSSSSLPSSSDHLERSMEALGSLLGGHGNLKTLVVAHRDDRNASGAAVIICWDGLAPPPLLERFEFSRRSGYIFARIPMWMGQLGNLCILKIAVRELLRHGVDILRGLPALTALSLYVQTPMVEWVVFGKQGFSALNYFKFSCGMPWLVFEAGAMPNIQKLKLLGFSAPDQDQHGSISIDHLPGLKEISAKVGGDDADAAVSALRIVVSNHPSNPSIKVQCVDSAFLYGDSSDSRLPGPSSSLNYPEDAITTSSAPSTSQARVPPRRTWTPSTEQRDAELLRTVYTRFVDIMTRLFPAVATAYSESHETALSCHLQAAAAAASTDPAVIPLFPYTQSSNDTTTTTESSSAYVHHSYGTVVKPEQSTVESSSQHQTTTTTITTSTTASTSSAIVCREAPALSCHLQASTAPANTSSSCLPYAVHEWDGPESPDVFRCLACFSFFIPAPTGCGFNVFRRVFGRREAEQQVDVVLPPASEDMPRSENCISWLLSCFQPGDGSNQAAGANSLKMPLLPDIATTSRETTTTDAASASYVHSHGMVVEGEQSMSESSSLHQCISTTITSEIATMSSTALDTSHRAEEERQRQEGSAAAGDGVDRITPPRRDA